jgi:hypothetical protein
MSSNADIIQSIKELRDSVESLRAATDRHKQDISIALAGDYTNPSAKPGLIQTVGRHVVECDQDRRKLWQAMKVVMSVIILILTWIVAGKVTAAPDPHQAAPSRIVTQP